MNHIFIWYNFLHYNMWRTDCKLILLIWPIHVAILNKPGDADNAKKRELYV